MEKKAKGKVFLCDVYDSRVCAGIVQRSTVQCGIEGKNNCVRKKGLGTVHEPRLRSLQLSRRQPPGFLS